MNQAAKTLAFLTKKYGLSITPGQKMPIEIINVGRNDLPIWFQELGWKTGAEIGVETGAYAEVLCRRNPGVHLFCVDAWKAYRGYREHVSQPKLDNLFTEARARLVPYHVTFIRKYSVEAAKDFPDGILDFVYLDANHGLEYVIADLSAWVPKVKPGGIIAGHDFVQRKETGYQVHVVEAVYAWTHAYFISPWFVIGQKAEIPGETRDRPRSWMWVHDPANYHATRR